MSKSFYTSSYFKRKDLLVIGSILLTTVSILGGSFLFVNKTSMEYLNSENENNIDNFVKGVETILNVMSPLLLASNEFMKRFTIYNSTTEEYAKFSGINNSSLALYVSNLRVFYNVTDTDRMLFESTMSQQIGKNITFTDVDTSTNKTFVVSPQRPWYCPLFYTAPLNNVSFVNSGTDVCFVPAFASILGKLYSKPDGQIILQARKQQITTVTELDFAIKTTNGFAMIAMNLDFIFENYKQKSIVDSIIYLNDNKIFSTCLEKCTNEKKYRKEITVRGTQELIRFEFIFNNYSLNYTTFYYILSATLAFTILCISGVVQFAIKTKKFEVANEMLGYVNHEIRNPMNCIQGMIDISLMDLNLNLNTANKEGLTKVTENLQVAKNACHLLNHVVNDILDFQKLSEGKLSIIKQDIDMSELERTIFNIVSPKLWEKPQVKYSFVCTGVTTFYTDESRIIQILLNFITNSVKFTNQGFIKVKVEKKGTDIEFSVRDSGRGIEEKDFIKIFEPFEQSGVVDSLRHGGIGLGLHLCKMLAHLMEGNIGFESTFGEGSKFWVKLPIH